MSGRMAERLGPRLRQLTAAQESIQGLRMWLLHHRSEADAAVAIWLSELRRAPPDERLKFIYLANDVLLEGRRKGSTNEGNQRRLERILGIWAQREAFPKQYLEHLARAMEYGEALQSPSDAQQGNLGDSDNLPLMECEELPDEMLKLDGNVAKVEELHATVQQLPEDVFSGAGVEGLPDEDGINAFGNATAEAQKALAILRQATNDQAARAQLLVRTLEHFIGVEQRLADRSVAALQDTRDKVQQATEIRKELRAHMASLPEEADVDTTADEPLPSLADLFGTG